MERLRCIVVGAGCSADAGACGGGCGRCTVVVWFGRGAAVAATAHLSGRTGAGLGLSAANGGREGRGQLFDDAAAEQAKAHLIGRTVAGSSVVADVTHLCVASFV